MNHRQHITHARAFSTFASIAFAFTLAAGCSTGQSAGSTESTGSYVQDLSTDLGVCSVAHDTCLQAADGDVSKIDTSVELFGTKYDSPIFVSPTGGNQFFHPDGEVAVARAARAGNHLQILSTSSNFSVEDVTKAIETSLGNKG